MSSLLEQLKHLPGVLLTGHWSVAASLFQRNQQQQRQPRHAKASSSDHSSLQESRERVDTVGFCFAKNGRALIRQLVIDEPSFEIWHFCSSRLSNNCADFLLPV